MNTCNEFTFQNREPGAARALLLNTMKASGLVSERDLVFTEVMLENYRALLSQFQQNYVCKFDAQMIQQSDEPNPSWGWGIRVGMREKRHQVPTLHMSYDVFTKPMPVQTLDALERAIKAKQVVKELDRALRDYMACQPDTIHALAYLMQSARWNLNEGFGYLHEANNHRDGTFTYAARQLEGKNKFLLVSRSMDEVVQMSLSHNSLVQEAHATNQPFSIDYATGWQFH